MTKTDTYTTHEPPPRALLFAVITPSISDDEAAASLAELKHLLTGLGIEIGPQVLQRQKDTLGPLVLGAGKLEELRELLELEQQRTPGHLALVFEGELSPGQQRNLTREFGVEVLDRTQVILRVFNQRARTRTARLEIELAELQYEAPRIRDDEAVGTRQGGGGGRAAKGHTSVELRKQLLRKRLAAIREELATADATRQTRRQRREQVLRTALVGYTNAGKSSLMKALTGTEVLVQDALFATLDTTVRALSPPTTPRIVVADTVGFLRNLPNHLLASFRSTLDEALDADLLLLVVDGADPHWAAHLETTREVLEHVEALTIPSLVVVNKVDRIEETRRAELAAALPGALFVSARSKTEVERLRAQIVEAFDARLCEAKLSIPFDQQALRAEIWAHARVLEEHFDEDGGHLHVKASDAQLAQWQKRLSGSAAERQSDLSADG